MLHEIPGQDAWPRIKLGLETYSMSRPLLERTLRWQVQRIGNIKVQGGCRALKVESESNVQAATGIQCQLSDGSLETIKSDLIVDASANGTLTLEFLKAIGRRPPQETRIGVNMRYASALFERSQICDGYKIVYTLPDAPEQGRGGLILQKIIVTKWS
jgi:hypothetical protein